MNHAHPPVQWVPGHFLGGEVVGAMIFVVIFCILVTKCCFI